MNKNTSSSGMCSHCLGLDSLLSNVIKSKAVSLVCRREETKIRTGFEGECVLIPLKHGLFMVAIRGQ